MAACGDLPWADLPWPCYCAGPSRPVPPQCLHGSAPEPWHRLQRIVFIQSSSLILGSSSDSSTLSLLAAGARGGGGGWKVVAT